MSDIHKRIYEILLNNAQRREPSISTLNKNGNGLSGGLNENGNDVYYAADPNGPIVENVLSPKKGGRKQVKKGGRKPKRGGFSVGDLFPALKLIGLGKGGCGCCGCCVVDKIVPEEHVEKIIEYNNNNLPELQKNMDMEEENPIANIPIDDMEDMMEFQDNGKMSGNKEAQELTSMLANNMRNPYVEQEELGQDQLAEAEGQGMCGGKYYMGYGGKNANPNFNKMKQGLLAYRTKYNNLRKYGYSPEEARQYLRNLKRGEDDEQIEDIKTIKVKKDNVIHLLKKKSLKELREMVKQKKLFKGYSTMNKKDLIDKISRLNKGGNFWDTLGNIAKTAAPFLPLLL